MLIFFLLISQAFAIVPPVCSSNYDFNVTSWISEIERINRCNPLRAPGDVRVFNVTRGDKIRQAMSQEQVSTSDIDIADHNLPADHKGTLKYLGDQRYEMVFQLDFSAEPSATVTADAMMNRVRSCLDAARPGLRGPNGEQLSLIAVTPQQASEMGAISPPAIPITVTKPRGRGNAQLYASDFNCDTILHELLHFAGLCDEYREGGSDKNASQCRALGPGDSIMGQGMDIGFDDSVGEIGRCDLKPNAQELDYLRHPDPVVREIVMRKKHYKIGNFPNGDLGMAEEDPSPKKAFCQEINVGFAPLPNNPDAAFSTLVTNEPNAIVVESFLNPSLAPGSNIRNASRTQLSCRCEPTNTTCLEFLNYLRPEAVAISSPQRKVYACPDFNTRQAPTDFAQPAGQFRLEGTTVHYRNRPMGRSLLHPAHFARVINGPCHIASTPDAVKKYNECARFSVKSSMDGIAGPNPCSTRPAYCDQPDTWLGALPTLTSP
jgi:hypothetical protein